MPPLRAKKIPSSMWKRHKEYIRKLRERPGMTTEVIVKEMQNEPRFFFASKSQYETQFKKWGWKRYHSSSDLDPVCRHVIAKYGKNADVIVTYNGVEVSSRVWSAQMVKFCSKTHVMTPNGNDSSLLPSGYSVRLRPNKDNSTLVGASLLPFIAWTDGLSLRDFQQFIPAMQNVFQAPLTIHERQTMDVVKNMYDTIFKPQLQAMLPSKDLDNLVTVPSSGLPGDDFQLVFAKFILFGIANNFAGLDGLDKANMWNTVKNTPKRELMRIIRSASGPTSLALMDRLLACAVEAEDVEGVDSLIREEGRLKPVAVSSTISKHGHLDHAFRVRNFRLAEVLLHHGWTISETTISAWSNSYPSESSQELSSKLALFRLILSSDLPKNLYLKDGLLYLSTLVYNSPEDCYLYSKQLLSHLEENEVMDVFEINGRNLKAIVTRLKPSDARELLRLPLQQYCSAFVSHPEDFCATENTNRISLFNFEILDCDNLLAAFVRGGHMELLEVILKSGVRLPYVFLLNCAIYANDVSQVRRLICKLDCSLDAPAGRVTFVSNTKNSETKLHETPFSAAIRIGNTEIFELLYPSAQPTFKNACCFFAALQAAMESKRLDLAESIIENGVPRPTRECLHQAFECVLLSIRDGMSLRRVTRPLLCLFSPSFLSETIYGSEEIFRLGRFMKESPLILAIIHNREDVRDELLSNPDILNFIATLSEGSVHSDADSHHNHIDAAVERGLFELARKLLSAGSYPDTSCLARSGIWELKPQFADTIFDSMVDYGANILNFQDDRLRNRKLHPKFILKVLQLGYPVKEEDMLNLGWDSKAALEITQKCLERFPRGNGDFGIESVFSAIHSRDTSTIKALLEHGVNPNCYRKDGFHDLRRPLAEAIIREDSESDILHLLLDWTKDLDEVCSKNGLVRETPLLVAIGQKKADTVRLLLDRGVKLNGIPALYISRTPLQKAAEVGSIEIVRVLINHGADVNAPPVGFTGATALQLAAMNCYIGIMEYLIHEGAEVTHPGAIHAGSAIELAAEHGRLDAVAYLLNTGLFENGVGLEQKDKARERAEKGGHQAVRKVFERGSYVQEYGD